MIPISLEILKKAEALAFAPDNLLIDFSRIEQRTILATRASLKEKEDKNDLVQAEMKSPMGKVVTEREFVGTMNEVGEK